MQQRVFVYGTLRRGGSNHRLISGERLLGEFITEPKYRMLDLGPFPGVVIPGDQAIVGEVFSVSAITLHALDRLEEIPHLYLRERIDSPWGNVWIYLYRRSAYKAPVVPGGDWMRYWPDQGASSPGRPG
jgi:gamma-glutamylcyclotransferase (GGCT)/AIG2-like uncharacterized protein YtfP